MKCPFCGTLDNKVIDSRLSQGGEVTRRRRECDRCQRRYTTYERVEQVLPYVVKRDGRREPFERAKILVGLHHACVKRPVSAETLERLADELERKLVETGEKEIPSADVGEFVMDALKSLDHVAYVRFASVYRKFEDTKEFADELTRLSRRDTTEVQRIRAPRQEAAPKAKPREEESPDDEPLAPPSRSLLEDPG